MYPDVCYLSSRPLTAHHGSRPPRSDYFDVAERTGRIRTRDVAWSIVTIAPASMGSRCSVSTRATTSPSESGKTFWARTWITLGPVAPLVARRAEKSRSCVNTTYPCVRAHVMIVASVARGSPTLDQ